MMSEQDEIREGDGADDRRRFLRRASAGVVGGALATTLLTTGTAEAAEGPDFITVDSLPNNDVLTSAAQVHAVHTDGSSYRVSAARLANEVGHTVSAIVSGDQTTWGSGPIGTATDIVFSQAPPVPVTPHVLILPTVATPVVGRPGPIIRIYQYDDRPLVLRAGSGATLQARADAEPGGGFRLAGRYSVVEARMLMNLPWGSTTLSFWSLWGDLKRTGA
jgi:hypothetical protein